MEFTQKLLQEVLHEFFRLLLKIFLQEFSPLRTPLGIHIEISPEMYSEIPPGVVLQILAEIRPQIPQTVHKFLRQIRPDTLSGIPQKISRKKILMDSTRNSLRDSSWNFLIVFRMSILRIFPQRNLLKFLQEFFKNLPQKSSKNSLR